MKRWPPVAFAGPGGTHVNMDPSLGRRGSYLDGTGYQQIIDEICAVVEAPGLVLDAGQSNQLLQAILLLIEGATSAIPSSALIHFGANDGGTPNTVTLTGSPIVPILAAGTTILFVSPYDNTGAATLQVDATAARPLRKPDGISDLGAGDLLAGTLAIAVYDGSIYRLFTFGPSRPIVSVADAGTANAMSGVGTPKLYDWAHGQLVFVRKGANANTSAAPTLVVDGLSAKTITKRDGSPLSSGDLGGAMLLPLWYDGGLDVLRLTIPVQSDLTTGVASAGAAYNIRRYRTNARVSATGSGGDPTPVWTGFNYQKKSGTSALVAWASFQSQWTLPSAPATYYRLASGAAYGEAVMNTPSSAFTIGNSGVLVIEGLPAGPTPLEFSLLRPDAMAWATIFNPRSSDYAGYASQTVAVLIIAEVELP